MAVALDSPAVPTPRPNPEVRERPTRRRVTLADNQRLLAAADAGTERGHLGALVRREGVAASQLATWRQHRRAGTRAGAGGQRRSDDAADLARRRRENARLTRDLEVAHAGIDVPKNRSVLLGVALPAPAAAPTP